MAERVGNERSGEEEVRRWEGADARTAQVFMLNMMTKLHVAKVRI